jgi:hypothetical protein
MTDKELSYWMALAYIGGWRTEKINRLAHAVLKEQQTGFEEFFSLEPADWADRFDLNEDEIRKLGELAAAVTCSFYQSM